jgi:hypothetical protein
VFRNGRSALALTLVLVATLMAIGALFWFVTQSSGTHEAGSSAPLAIEARPEPLAPVAGETARADSRDGARLAQSKQPLAPPPIATGTLRIRALDAGSREPIAGLGFVVVRKRGGETVLARGRTGADGRALVRDLEEDTLCVRTERAPPHAPAAATVSVVAGREDEHEILVGSGGSIVGRVVDDRKLPVAGAALYLSPPVVVFDLGEPLAKTGPDGRFRIECAAGEPRELALLDGDPLQQAWNPVPVLAVLGGRSASAEVVPRTGEDVDVGDLELARAAKFSGHVVDPDERPVAGALVSLREGRLYARGRRPTGASDELLRCGPADAGFQLLAGETLTDAGGRFELEADGSGTSVVVWTRAGALQGFRLPKAEPGAKKDELVLKLEPRTSIALELVDADGAPVPVPAAEISSSGLWAPWGAAGVFGEGRVSVLARAGGTTLAWDSSSARGEDGKWRLQLKVDSARIEELTIHASGYESLVEHPPTGFTARIELQRVLEPLPKLHVRLVPEDRGAKLLPAPGAQLQLHVCMADPLRHANAALGFCCGNGVFWKGNWRGDVLPLVLPVKRKGAFFVHARGRGGAGEYHDVASFGPFDPGPEEHELVLDPARLADAGAGSSARGERFTPASGDPVARLSAKIEDARTGKPIPFAALLLDESVAAPRKPRVQRLDADEGGRIRRAAVRPGRWSVRAVVRGYARNEVAARDFAEGETLDLGTLALEPLPAHSGRLLAADGKPLGGVWLMLVDDSGQEPDTSRSTESVPDGGFTFFGELPPKLLLHAERPAPGPGQPAESQRFALALWPRDEVELLRFSPSRRVVVLLAGTNAGDVPMQVSVCPALSEPTAACDHRLPLLPWHLPLESAAPIDPLAGAQRCALRLAPGRYQLYGQSLLHVLPLTEIQVVLGTGDLELTLGVQ